MSLRACVFSFFVLLSVTLAGCTSAPPSIPIETGTINDPPPLPPSQIGVAFQTNLGLISNDLTQQFAGWKLENPGGEHFLQYGIYPKPPVIVTGSGNTITITANVVYRAGLRLTSGIGIASCGFNSDPIKHAAISVTSGISFTQNYEVQTNPSFNVDLLDPCNVSFMGKDARALLLGLVQGQLQDFRLKLADEIRQRSDFEGRAAQAWALLSQPIAVSSSPPIWLVVQPKGILAGLPLASGTTLVETAGISAQPQLIVSNTRPAAPLARLPPLSQADGVNGMHIIADGIVDWDVLNAKANHLLLGKIYTKHWFWFFGAHETVTNVRVTPDEKKVLFAVQLKGVPLTGTIYLWGTPSIDQEGANLIFGDVDYTVSTRSAIGSLDWILHSSLRQQLSNIEVPLQEPITRLQQLLNTTLNRQLAPDLFLAGAIQPIYDIKIYPEENNLVVRATLDGQLSVEYR